MGVYIKGMAMPRACVYRENGHLLTCPLYDIDGYCGALKSEASHKADDAPSNCPLVPVPPHGRLIDADALIQNKKIDTFDAVFAVAEAPTIIPAEEGET